MFDTPDTVQIHFVLFTYFLKEEKFGWILLRPIHGTVFIATSL